MSTDTPGFLGNPALGGARAKISDDQKQLVPIALQNDAVSGGNERRSGTSIRPDVSTHPPSTVLESRSVFSFGHPNMSAANPGYSSGPGGFPRGFRGWFLRRFYMYIQYHYIFYMQPLFVECFKNEPF